MYFHKFVKVNGTKKNFWKIEKDFQFQAFRKNYL